MSKMKDHQKPAPKPTIKQPSGSRRIIFIVVILLLIPVLVEAVLRTPGVGPTSYAPRRFEPNGRVPFVPSTNSRATQMVYDRNLTFSSVYDPRGDTRGYFGPEGRVLYRLNTFGIRGGDIPFPKPPNGFRVVCLGDSITFGEGVKEEDTYPVQLQRLLAGSMSDKQVEVINQGVQGYGTKEEVEAYFMVGRAYRPDVVLVGFYLNDATDFGETIRQNDAKNRELALTGLAKVSKVFEILERRRIAQERQDEFFASTRKSFDSPLWQECKDQFLRLKRDTLDWKARMVVVVFPVLWQLDAYPLEDIHTKLATEFKRLGLESLDLLDAFRGKDAESLWVHPTDQHPNEIAHTIAAEKIAEYLRKPAPAP